MADIFEKRSKSLSEPARQPNLPIKLSIDPFLEKVNAEKSKQDPFAQRAQQIQQTPMPSNEGFLPAFSRGTQGGVLGYITGHQPTETPENQPWYEHIAQLAGKLVSDYPAMVAGAEVGALGGGTLGSIVPGIGTGIGGLLGAGAGALALPTAIDKSFEEYYDYAKKGGDKSFGDYLESIGRITEETGKQALVGGATGIISKALPILRKIPAFQTLLNTNLGRKAVSTGLEYSTFTLGQAAVEGRTPTMQEAVDNAMILGALKTTGKLAKTASQVGENLKVKEQLKKIITEHPLIKNTKKLMNLLPTEVKQLGQSVLDLKQNTQEKMYFEMLKDNVGERNARIIDSQFKWRNELEKAEKIKKFTPQELEEMMYYRQKTGNPKIENDTYKDLSSRLPEHAKKFVDEVVGPHLEESLRLWNENKLTNKINPREGLADVYLPGLYEYDPVKFNRAYDEISRQFKTKNPFSNPKKFMSYLDAFQAKGLKPRYKNIVDLMRAFDLTNIKILSNLEFLNEIKRVEKGFKYTRNIHDLTLNKMGLDKLIVNSQSRKKYELAKRAGYVPFDDVFLRRYVSASKEAKPEKGSSVLEELFGPLKEQRLKEKPDKKLKFATTSAPALVHPDLAPAIQGVFRKEPYRSPGQIERAHDALMNELRHIKVAGSLFHYGSLFQHTGGALGFKKAFQSIAPWYTDFKADADSLLANKEVMKDAARSGLVVHRRIEGLGEKQTQMSKALDKLADQLPQGIKDLKHIDWFADKVGKAFRHLFEIHHPRLKIKAWNDMTNDFIKREAAKGTKLTPEFIKQAKRDIAKNVNNIYGGQQWETMRFLNNPRNMKYFRNLIAFPDWTLSQIRNADVGLPGGNPSIAQKEARRFWVKYGLFLGAFHGFMKWFYGGLTQSDKENKSISGITFDPSKAFHAINPKEQEPGAWYKVQLPDIPMKIAGKEYNPGRDEKGRKLYAQMMKSVLELGGWARHGFTEFFHKSNPIIQAVWKQVMDSTPNAEGNYPVQSVWRGKRLVPWEGTEPGTLGRLTSRAKELASEFKPFSLGNIEREGYGPFIASGLGAASVSKGLSLMSSEPYIKKAIKSSNVPELNKIRQALKSNGYKDRQIKATITKMRNELKQPR